MTSPTDNFTRITSELYGEAGLAWLQRLPDLLANCAHRWSLTISPPFPNLTYNYVAPAVRTDGTPVVLKVGFPHNNDEFLTEIAALRIYAGQGSVQLLDADEAWGVLVLERLQPGVSLLQHEDDQAATSIAANVMRELWRPAPPGNMFPTVSDWANGLRELRPRFDGTTGPLPTRMVETAEALFAELLPSMSAPVLLHGDLHYDNILSSTRRPWLAIDPKGILGEPAYEVGALLRNPPSFAIPSSAIRRDLARRVDQFAAELAFDRQRIIGWGIAQAVLSAWWTVEDHGHGWESSISCAEILSSLR